MKEVSIDSKKVQVIGIIISIPIIVLFVLVLCLKWDEVFKQNLKEIKESLLFFDNKRANVVLVILIPNLIIILGIIIHELIHGVFMAFFSENSWKSVRFGFVKKYLMPFANCKEALLSKKMLIVSLAPFFILGFFPSLYGIFYNNLFFLFIGFSMTLGAVGDFIYAYLIIKTGLGYKLLDHDSKVGFKIVK
ncbi:DUF3267 domain-containing protein [Flavobacterium sp. ov086]|uniref:DUF3267 domain-containing protein n=1 Tax=Flavobacterium sp. ov086 TaxID=1761785 RepID=UPI000B667241|nr:DUF3267 domain-containing protein [Flavobacterium sp. ov086]SNR24442.1 Putative zincin peptidase [Flavobacterium sp. ov086]